MAAPAIVIGNFSYNYFFFAITQLWILFISMTIFTSIVELCIRSVSDAYMWVMATNTSQRTYILIAQFTVAVFFINSVNF